MGKHLERKAKFPVLPQQAPGEVWDNQNPSPAGAGAPGETSAGWESRKQPQIQSCCLSRAPPQAGGTSCEPQLCHSRAAPHRAGNSSHQGALCHQGCFLYLRRTRGSSGGPGDQHLEMCRTSRFPETLGPGRSPGVKGRMGKSHRNTISLQSPRGKWAPREIPSPWGARLSHSWVIAQQEMQNGSGALPAGQGTYCLLWFMGFLGISGQIYHRHDKKRPFLAATPGVLPREHTVLSCF